MLFSGATTKMHVFGLVASFISQNNWKIRLFPKPVGKIAITSRLEIRASIICFTVLCLTMFSGNVTNIPTVLQPSSACQWFRLLTFCCQRFTYQPIVFLRCEANAYFIGSGCAGSLSFLFSGSRPRFSRLGASPIDALSRAWLSEEKKRDGSQSRLRAVSLFLSPSNKTRENAYARDWRRGTGNAWKKRDYPHSHREWSFTVYWFVGVKTKIWLAVSN